MLDEGLIARFHASFVRGSPDECWLWLKSGMPKGYGQIKRTGERRQYYAHRVAYEVAFGSIPQGKQVCHKCDNPRCVNPAHLFIGTSHDNHQDMRRKGRQYGSKLTDQQAREVWALLSVGTDQSDLASRYGVGQSTISRIARGQSYASVTGRLSQHLRPKE